MAKKVVTAPPCDRDAFGKERTATTSRSFSIDGNSYRIRLCEQHAAQFDREWLVWARLAEPVESAAMKRSERYFTEAERETARKAAALRHEQHEREHHNVVPLTKPVLAPTPAKQVPNTTEWVLTPHARERAEQRGIPLAEVLAVAANPEQSYGGAKKYGVDSRIHQRGDCAVVVNPEQKVVISVLHRTQEQYHPTAHRSELNRMAQ